MTDLKKMSGEELIRSMLVSDRTGLHAQYHEYRDELLRRLGLVGRCREYVEWHTEDNGDDGVEARALLKEIPLRASAMTDKTPTPLTDALRRAITELGYNASEPATLATLISHEQLERQLARADETLVALHKDCLASDFNEAWDSYKAVEAYLKEPHRE